MSFSRSDVSAKKHMARVSDLYRERVRSIKTVLFFIVSVSLLTGETVPTYPSNNLTKIDLSVQQFLIKQIGKKKHHKSGPRPPFLGKGHRSVGRKKPNHNRNELEKK